MKVTPNTARELMKPLPIKELHRIAGQSGVSYHTMRGWKYSQNPSVSNFIAVADVLGYDVVLVEKSE